MRGADLLAAGWLAVAVVPPSADERAPLWLLAGLLVAAGLVGAVLPLLPGAPLVFLGLLLGAWIDGFQRVGAVTLSLLALLAPGSLPLALLPTRPRARPAGAGRLAGLGA